MNRRRGHRKVDFLVTIFLGAEYHPRGFAAARGPETTSRFPKPLVHSSDCAVGRGGNRLGIVALRQEAERLSHTRRKLLTCHANLLPSRRQRPYWPIEESIEEALLVGCRTFVCFQPDWAFSIPSASGQSATVRPAASRSLVVVGSGTTAFG